jgi:hypothetical protein
MWAWRSSYERLYETLAAGPFEDLKQKATGHVYTRGRKVFVQQRWLLEERALNRNA